MNYITIKPLLKLLAAAQKRSHLTLGDLVQLETKINNQIKIKRANPAQKHSIFIEEEYLQGGWPAPEQIRRAPGHCFCGLGGGNRPYFARK